MIEIVFEDILKQDVDAIVNPANSYMLHGGGLARAIIEAGGANVARESARIVERDGPVPTGEAIVTDAGWLPFKGIIHVVGPYWKGEEDEPDKPYWHENTSEEDADKLLSLAYFNALRRAHEEGWKTIAFPAISCGIFKFPVKRAAPIAIETLRKHQGEFGIEKIRICVLDDAHYDAFMEAGDE